MELLSNSSSNNSSMNADAMPPPTPVVSQVNINNINVTRTQLLVRSSSRRSSRRSILSSATSSRRSLLSTSSTALELDHLYDDEDDEHEPDISDDDLDLTELRPGNPVMLQLLQRLNSSMTLDTALSGDSLGPPPAMMTATTAAAVSAESNNIPRDIRPSTRRPVPARRPPSGTSRGFEV